MEDNILKKMAIRSMALMVCVLFISAVCAQYKEVEIYANEGQRSEELIVSALDVANLDRIDHTTKELEVLLNIEGKEYKEKPEELLGNKYIVIDKPDVGESTIGLEDYYMERSIKLTITGLETESLDYNSVSRMNNLDLYKGKPYFTSNNEKSPTIDTNDIARNITLSYEHDIEQDRYIATIIMELDTVYTYTIYQDKEHYYIKLQKPKDVYEKLIVIDAGHGGNDVGTFPKGMEYVEKDMNLSIVLYLKKLLDQEDIKVYYTRLTDTKPYLRPRVRLANDLEADYFISIHCNGSNLIQPYGTEVLYNEKSTIEGNVSKELAQISLEELTKVMNSRNRGIVSGSEKYIIGNSNVPVALLEVAYMTNQNDLEFLKNSDNRKLVAKGIYNGIIRVFKELD